jgi:hypothetical protein
MRNRIKAAAAPVVIRAAAENQALEAQSAQSRKAPARTGRGGC